MVKFGRLLVTDPFLRHSGGIGTQDLQMINFHASSKSVMLFFI
jgi:hypothetical protein